MAMSDLTKGEPAASVGAELYYAETEGTALVQIFGVQSVPVISSAKEDITWRSLESDEEFSTKGVRAAESIEIEVVSQRKQHDDIKALADANKSLWWYVKLPDSYTAPSVSKPKVIKWKGSVDITYSEIALDDMVKDTIKIGKANKPEEIDGLPSASA